MSGLRAKLWDPAEGFEPDLSVPVRQRRPLQQLLHGTAVWFASTKTERVSSLHRASQQSMDCLVSLELNS